MEENNGWNEQVTKQVVEWKEEGAGEEREKKIHKQQLITTHRRGGCKGANY